MEKVNWAKEFCEWRNMGLKLEEEVAEDKTKQLLLDNILRYGHDTQHIKAIEEMAELTKEICKLQCEGRISYIDLAEEMADVEIMLEQLKLMHELHSLVEVQKVKKLNRLRGRLKGEIN